MKKILFLLTLFLGAFNSEVFAQSNNSNNQSYK